MNTPNWFVIIKQWRTKKMGEYGVTLPFLVGALAYVNGQEKASLNDVIVLFDEMIENPADGYMVEIRWCGDIQEPVMSMRALNDPFVVAIKGSYSRPKGGGMSVAFTDDLMSMFNLNCKTAAECRDKLTIYAKDYVENGYFSKNLNPETMKREFGCFSERDIQYIKSVIPANL